MLQAIIDTYELWEIGLARYFAWGQHNLGLVTNLGGTNGIGNVGSVFRLGGYGQLTGLRVDQLKGNYKGLMSAIYYRRYDAIPVIEGIVGAIFEYGGAWETSEDISSSTAIFSAGAFVGAKTPIGVLQFGMAFTDQGDVTAFSRIGRVF